MPGYDRSRIIGVSNEDIEEFICGICLEVLCKPIVVQCCGQTYCSDCIISWLKEKDSCPNDRRLLTADQLKSPPKMVTNLLSNMKIKCEFHEVGCQITVNIGDLDKHITDQCEFNPSRCCCNCGQPSLGHTDQNCIKILAKKFNEFELKYVQTIETKDKQINDLELKLRDTRNDLEQKLQKCRTDCDRYERLNDELKKTIIDLQSQIRSLEYSSGNLLENFKPDNSAKSKLIQKFIDEGIISIKVANVMKLVDRANYCPKDPYVDKPQQIGYGVNISAPHMHARALNYLKDHLVHGTKALDVGSGSGYITACMGVMVGSRGMAIGIDCLKDMISISIANIKKDQPNFIESNRVKIIQGDGKAGYELEAPYDAIHIGAAIPVVPQKLLEQLKPGGRMIVPIGKDKETQNLTQIDKMSDGSIKRQVLTTVVFQSMI